MAGQLSKVRQFTKKARTPKQGRQWKKVYRSQLSSGRSKKIAIMSANAAVRDSSSGRPSRGKRRGRYRRRERSRGR